ncbi:MAG: glycosyltransferase family 2 protein [Phycisphaerae bacterium]|nr:glycosyltransferase family 2 protein [Phycisphaerae bacterium]
MPLTSLSICIPTYNFGKFIGETLESIVCQLTDKVEIVVLDGASTDNTSDIVRQFQADCPNLTYHRLDKRGGIDRDIAKSVELANGEYCWLFSSDDIMRQGAIAKMLGQIKHGHDLYLCKHTNCTFNMKFYSEHPVLRTNKEVEFNLTNQLDRQRYFNLAITTEAFFSFMGGVIVKKSRWDSVPMNEMFVGSCWTHVVRIFELMPKGLTVKYIAEPLLDRREGNDSFSDKGVVNRYRIAIDGYHKIGDVFFGHKSFEAYHIRRVIRYEFNLRNFLRAKVSCWKNPSREDKSALDALFHKAYSDSPLLSNLKYFIYKFSPNWLLYPADKVYSRIKKYWIGS